MWSTDSGGPHLLIGTPGVLTGPPAMMDIGGMIVSPMIPSVLTGGFAYTCTSLSTMVLSPLG